MMLWESSYCYIFRVGVYKRALVFHQASRIFSVQQYIVTCLFQDLPYFPHYIINRAKFEKEILNIKGVF